MNCNNGNSSSNGKQEEENITRIHDIHEEDEKKSYKGIRRRKWGKWVSEIRVPGTSDRLWLGSYTTPEAAAVAHDIAFYCLRKPSSLSHHTTLNFPNSLVLPSMEVIENMSPRSIQRAASDAAMAVDAQMKMNGRDDDGNGVHVQCELKTELWEDMEMEVGNERVEDLSVSIEDYL